MKSDKSDFTQGSILAKLSFFMLPILGALVLQAAYGAVDLLVVGRFGSTSGLSAVSTGSQVLNLVTFVVTQLAMGVTVLIARYFGEKKPQHIGQVIGGAAVVFTLLAALLFVILVFFARPISGLMQAPAEALDSTARYVGIKVDWVIIRTMLLSGALCGLAGFLLVGASDHTISVNTAGGRGFTAVMVSWMAKFNPIGMIFTSLLLVFLGRGSSEISSKFQLNDSFGDILTGIILFFIIGCEFFINYKISLRKTGGKEEK